MSARTNSIAVVMSAIDPKRTFAGVIYPGTIAVAGSAP